MEFNFSQIEILMCSFFGFSKHNEIIAECVIVNELNLLKVFFND